MAKFEGNIGFIHVVETSPGVHEPIVTEKFYKGDILRNTQAWEKSQNLNPDLTIDNRFSIVADSYSLLNCSFIRYITVIGVKWEVISIEIRRPRLILSVKGVYNG